MDTKSVMDGASMRGAMGEGKKVAGQYEEQESDGKRRKRKKAPVGGRRIIVGMKLATACREVLTWTIAKVAHPGDLVIALHVAPFPIPSGNGHSFNCFEYIEAAKLSSSDLIVRRRVPVS